MIISNSHILFMKSIYGSLFLSLSILKLVSAGPLPSARPVVDVRGSLDDVLPFKPSTVHTWYFASDPSMEYDLSDIDFGSAYDGVDLIYGTNKNVVPRSDKGVVIQRRKKKKVKDAASKATGSNQAGGGVAKAGKVIGAVGKGVGEAEEATAEIPILGEAVAAVAVFLNVLSKIFSVVAHMEAKSAQVSLVLSLYFSF